MRMVIRLTKTSSSISERKLETFGGGGFNPPLPINKEKYNG